MPRYKLTLEYDGTRYAGWQLQKNARSLQGELIEAIQKVFVDQTVEVYGAGRTDAGVHARGQVAHLSVRDDLRLRPEQMLKKINDLLSHDLNILKIEPVDERFHARHGAKSRTYGYQISKRRDAFGKKFVWWVREPLDIRRMKAAAAVLTGFHDFRAFGDIDKKEQSTTVELQSIEIVEDQHRIYIRIKGSHFLWKMVRRMVGVLVEVGNGKMTVEQVSAFLAPPYARDAVRLTAPPSGLFLEAVEY